MYSFYLVNSLLLISALGFIGFLLSFERSRKTVKKIIDGTTQSRNTNVTIALSSRSEPTLVKKNKHSSLDNNTYDKPAALTQGLAILYLMAPSNQRYKGYAVWEVMNSQNLTYDPKAKIFHSYSAAHKTDVFSIANAAEPGYLVNHSISNLHIPGLCFFTNPTDAVDPLEGFKHMLNVANRLADLLGGVLCDDCRRPLSETSLHDYYYRLSNLKITKISHG